MALTATYRGDDLEITFTGIEVRGDDPSWSSVEDIEICDVTLCGERLDLILLPSSVILALMDRADNLEWN